MPLFDLILAKTQRLSVGADASKSHLDMRIPGVLVRHRRPFEWCTESLPIRES